MRKVDPIATTRSPIPPNDFSPHYNCEHCNTKQPIILEITRTTEQLLAMLKCSHYVKITFTAPKVSPTVEQQTNEILENLRQRASILTQASVVASEDVEEKLSEHDQAILDELQIEADEMDVSEDTISLVNEIHEQAEILFNPPIAETHPCPICQKPVEIQSTNEQTLYKKYNLACGHYVIVSAGSNFNPEIPDSPTKQQHAPLAQPSAPTKKSTELVPDEKWEKFLDYQKTGVQFLADSGFRALLGDEMGLGKTIQAIGMLRYFPEETLPALVICPGSVTIKWQREFKKWFNDKFPTLEYAPFIHKESIGGLIEGQKLFIMSNGILSKPGMLAAIKAYGFKTIIIDESHQYKNANSKRTKALFEVASYIPQVLLMSGTSVMNRVMEYYNTLHLLRPRRWFHKRQLSNMCVKDDKGKPLALSNYYKEEFFQNTKDYILRRTKDEVLKDLPKKFITEEWISIANSKNLVQAYNNKLDELQDIFNEMENGKNDAATQSTLFGVIAELRHMVGTIKALRAIEYATELVSTTGEKLCIGVHHRMGLGILEKALAYKRCPSCKNFVFESQDSDESSSNGLKICPTCEHDISAVEKRAPVCISSESPETKQARLDKFRTDPDQCLCILSILGGGVGIDVQFCPNVLVIEREWNRAIEDQFENRFHRIGMTNQVTICYMKAQDTIDEFFDDLVKLKEQVSGSTLNEDFETSPEFMFSLAQRVLVKRLKFVGA